jgi:hypothetical protein
MKKFILIAFSIVVFLFVQAQNTTPGHKYAIKAYNLTSFYSGNTTSKLSDSADLNFTTNDLKILHPTLAFQWLNAKGNYHELELTSFELGELSNLEELSGNSGSGNTIPKTSVITTNIAFRYEYILNFNKSETHKLIPSLGFGGSPYYRLYKYQAKYSWEIPSSQQFIGLSIFATPRLTYNFSSRIFLDLNIPVCVFDFNLLTNHQDNPFLELSERTTSEFNIDMFPKILSGRVGVGLKL